MVKEKEELLEKLRQVKQTAENYLAENNFDNYIVKNVVRYNKEVELIKKDSEENKADKFHLYVVELENTNPELEGEDILTELEYLEDENGNLYTISDLIQEYERFENIKDVVDKTKENEEKPEAEQDEELKKDSLEELEEEKEIEEEKEEKSEKKKEEKETEKEEIEEDTRNDLTGTDPKYVMQTIDVDQAYIDEWTTVRQGYGLPPEVEEIAIASPNQKDDHILSDTMSIYMLDNHGKIIESVKGKTIKDYFEIDDATGHNPIDDDNTKLELDGHAEVDQDQTMRRFKSKENPDLYLSIEQKEIGGYHEVYAGQKTRDGNDAVEIQLETRNVEIQTDLEMQKIISGRKGIYNKEEIDKEAELHAEHGDDEEKMAIENADGDAQTRVVCDSPYVPDTQITWEQFAKLLGKEDSDEIIEEFFEKYNGKNGHELILRMQAEYRENKTENELEKVEDCDIDRIDDEYVHIVITEETQVPGKNMTVKEWAEELGESTDVIVARLQREVDKDDERQSTEIIEEIEADYERAGHEHKH